MTPSFSTLRVRYAETDSMGVAYHGALLPWFEIGRTDWIRRTGLSYREIESRWHLHLAVVEASLRYERRILYDDEIVVRAVPTQLGAASIIFDYVLSRKEERVASGRTRHGCVDSSGQPLRWPHELRELFETR